MASICSPGWSSELHQTASEGRAGDLQRLLQEGHSPMARGGVGWWIRGAYQGNRTPLHYAAKHGHLACIRLLLCYGADPNAVDEDGYTPLHYLSQCHTPRPEWVESLRLGSTSLLRYGAEPRMRTKGGHTPLMLATTHGNIACQTVLEEHGKTVQPLLLLTRNVVVQLIHSKQLPSVEQLWIPESLRSFLNFRDVVESWKQLTSWTTDN